jgi:FixJ family two-component response regulator
MPPICRAIAVVEDEEPVRKALGRLLKTFGFAVTTFASGDSFLDSLSTSKPDCAILDLHLPGISGLEIQKRLSREKAEVPCIVITGQDEVGTRERVLAAGATAYLTKPLDEGTLIQAISSAIPESGNSNAS